MKIKLVINYKIPLNKNIILKTKSTKSYKKKSFKKKRCSPKKNILNGNLLLEYDLETTPTCNINYSLINSLPKF